MTNRHRFTRQVLYELVWSEPLRQLAARYEFSDVGLAKACRRANIPRPERGYWARRKAGKKTVQRPLPPRGPGMSDEVEIGNRWPWASCHLSEEEILRSNPIPPEFEEDMSAVEARVRAQVGRVPIPKRLSAPHTSITRLLEEDESRREKQRNSSYVSSWDAPLFDTPFERRRLRILNGLFLALERFGAKPWIRGREVREQGVQVGAQSVSFKLGPISSGRRSSRSSSPKTALKWMRLTIAPWWKGPDSGLSWNDSEGAPLEKQLGEVVVQLILAGERQYRRTKQGHYEWQVERKAELEEEIRKRKEEEERLERERLIQLEKDRVDRLLTDAMSLRQAGDIRSYVAAVQERCTVADNPVSISSNEFEAWADWAQAQADRIDPVRSGKYRESMRDR